MNRFLFTHLLLLACCCTASSADVETHRLYLSGTGCDDMRQWQFRCTDPQHAGRNLDRWTTIGVPSCWELQGFGTYQYGMRFYGKPRPEGIASERGEYRYDFTLPQEWAGRQIELVFEASMTDTYATINGRKAGELHQGGFTPFRYDVSDRVFFGKHTNRLEVSVSKESAADETNMAERRADYWNFGGIFRPVYIVSKPAVCVQRTAIDATMHGAFRATAYTSRAQAGLAVRTTITDAAGKRVATATAQCRSDKADITANVSQPHLWSAETPYLYTATFELLDASGATLHRHAERFGFRTIEVREHDGLYINGMKVMMRGVNRHSFRPESGRTLSKQKNIEDVLLIKGLNMNAVRLSHYPADPEFYDACDSLGLYIVNEMPGWHWAHNTVNGTKLLREFVTRDVNHPSVVFWSNGNEGGFNYELEPEFTRLDPQRRPVLYPWGNRNGFDTKHYRSYGETEEYMRRPEIFMPTEFLHGLYDGGHGAGLADYWQLMRSAPRCAGGFLWDLADEGVVRTDRGGIVDCVGNFGADGIVGPHFEPEGSVQTIRQVWCPVQVSLRQPYDGTIDIDNRYDFTPLRAVSLAYRYLRYDGTDTRALATGAIRADAMPHTATTATLPAAPQQAEALEVSAKDAAGQHLFTWVFKLRDTESTPAATAKAAARPHATRTAAGTLTVEAAGTTYAFSTKTGTLQGVKTRRGAIDLANGPRFVAYRRADRSFDQFYNHDDPEAEKKKTLYTPYADQGRFDSLTTAEQGDSLIVTATYRHGSLQSVRWAIAPDGTATLTYSYYFNGVVDLMGIAFDYPEANVRSKQWLGAGPDRVWQNRLHGPQLGIWANDYNDPVPGETFTYPEFKGYFAAVQWMTLTTTQGRITLQPQADDYIGVYQPRDGRDALLYTLPETGLSVLQAIPAVRNKVNTTDLNGPSAQPRWAQGTHTGTIKLAFE